MRILLGVLLGLVAISMLAYLVPGGFGNGTGSAAGQNVVAAVGDEKITATDVQRSIQGITRGQTNLPKGILAMYVPSMVNQMIESKALAYKAREMGFRISDQELGDAIASELAPAFGGKFDMNTYQMALAQQGISVADFENERRQSMLAQRLENLESQSIVVSDKEARAEYARKNLKVGLQYVNFDPKQFASKVNKDPAAVKAYFDKNRSQFRISEKRDFELIVGSTTDFLQKAKISDAELQREYSENIDSYRQPERVQVRHILIKTQGKPKEEAPKLKAKAEDILKQLQKGGDFAELAKKNSEDPGSAEKGGELGWIVRGQTVPNFEKAAFSLKPGELSGVIETEYGYHILQVENKQAAHTQSFDEVKGNLLAEAQKQAASEDLRKAAEAAHSEIARNPAQAEAIAKKYDLKFSKQTNATTNDTLPGLNNASELTNAIFAAAKGTVTDLVTLDNQNKDAFAVVTGITPARPAEFNEVQSQVLQKYTDAESQRLAQEAAAKAADSARKGESLEAIAKPYGLTVKTAAPFTVDGAAEGIGSGTTLAAAFKENVGGIVGPVATSTGQFVCRVSERVPADMSQFAKNKDSIVQGLVQQRLAVQGPLFRDSIVAELKRRGKIKINNDTLNRIISSYQS
ncbi:MAG: peptidyl-prolyl cis-trans isomerase [Acidobacteriaceae bacterium]|nr:peptidyl-prolyl cis-trans isomerase [Acidobacteriaceae bacterium]